MTALRLLQGLGGAAGIAIARAIVRDLEDGREAERLYGLLMVVAGAAPILAPALGGQLLRACSWRGLFVAVAALGAGLLAMTWREVAETLPPGRRQRGPAGSLATARRLWRDPTFSAYALCGGLSLAAMFAYIAASPFLLEDARGLSPQGFSLVFATNALGIVVAAQLGRRGRGSTARRRLALGLALSSVGAGALLLAVAAGSGLPTILAALFAVVAAVGLTLPASTSLALDGRPPETVGTASALLGLLQLAVGGAAAPLAGLRSGRPGLAMALVIAALTSAAWAAFGLARAGRRRTGAGAPR